MSAENIDVDGSDPAPTDGQSLPAVLVVTHPLRAAGENATRSLLDVLGAITSVALVTADLPHGSVIRDRFEVAELSNAGPTSSILVAAGRFLVNQVRMCRAISRRDEPLVLFFGATAYLLPVIWAKLLGRTVVIEPRGDVPLALRLDWERTLPGPVARLLAGSVRLFERIDFRFADAIITYTPGVADQLDLDHYEAKLYANGARYVDVDRFSPTVPFDERENTVGFVGRLAAEKGIDVLAAVARQLPDDIAFRFIGDGPLRDWLEDTLRTEIEDGSVEVTGWVDHEAVPAELNRLRLLVLPSRPTEGLPTTILEAMACGTPVYATAVSGVPDVIRDGEGGFLMDTPDAPTMATEIEHILDRDDLAEVGTSGRSVIEDEFSYEAAIDRYRRILQAIYSM